MCWRVGNQQVCCREREREKERERERERERRERERKGSRRELVCPLHHHGNCNGLLWGVATMGLTYLRKKNPPMKELIRSVIASGNFSRTSARVALQSHLIP